MNLTEAPTCEFPEQVYVDTGTPEQKARIERVLNGLRPPVPIEGEPSASLADRMRALCIPGVSIAVMRNGAIDWARGFGLTGNEEAMVSESTLFQAASISKSVSAVAALTLVQAGRLDLDLDVDTYLKSWKLPPTSLALSEKVTIRRLLNHTAGMTVHGFEGYGSEAPVPSLVEILDGVSPANNASILVDVIPGARFRYSGGGYTILQQIMNDVTGESFPDFVRESVLAPLGMTRSRFDQPLLGEQVSEAAFPHDANGDLLDSGPHIYPELAAAGLWTTAIDLAHFALALTEAGREKPDALLSPFIARQMFLPGLGQYGLGLIVTGNSPHQRFYHDGANAGYQSLMLVDAVGDGAAIMTNSDNGHLLIWDVVRGIANEYGWCN